MLKAWLTEGQICVILSHKYHWRIKMNEMKKSDVFGKLPKEFGEKYGFYYYNEIDSTNTEAKRLIGAGAKLPFAVVADFQSAGRGRLGRSFFSPSESGLYTSIAIDPRVSGHNTQTVTAFVATAVADALDALDCGVDIGIKWVNDLYVNARKICGILCEAGSSNAQNGIDYVIIGIGINLSQKDFPSEIKDIAGSILSCGGKVPKREELLAKIIENVDQYRNSFIDDYRKRSIVLGKTVKVMDKDAPYTAKAIEITDNGNLVVQTEDNQIKNIAFGEISVRLDK